VVSGLRQLGIAGRIEPPLEHVALDDQCVRKAAAGFPLRRRANVHQERTGADRAVIGSTRYMDIALPHRRLEIGSTWLAPSAQRTGANVEAKRLLLAHAFDVLGMQKVVFKTEVLNTQSRTAILALGAVEEGIFRKQLISATGRPRDMIYFSILDTEWPSVRARLEQRLARYAAR